MGSTPVAVHSCVCLQNHSIIIIVKANKSNGFLKSSGSIFNSDMKGVWGFPKNQNGRIGCKAEPLIFSVCTDTGCACYSLKSHIRRYNALPLLQKQGRIFFENFSFRYLRFDLKMSVVKKKFFAAILNKRQKGVRCKVKGVL
jgi:hypothetical protein